MNSQAAGTCQGINLNDPDRLLIQKREAARLTQAELAERLDEYQSFVAQLESGQCRVDVVEFIRLAETLGFDPAKAIAELKKTS